MAFKITNDLAELMLAVVKSELDGGFLYIYAGTVPAAASDALDMGAVHTELVMLSVGGDGVTGLTFSASVDALVAKNPAENWDGVIAFDGFDAATTTKTPTFFRFCPAGDNGRGAASTPRLQGTVGGPASSADLKLGSDTLTDNGNN